MKTYIWTWPTRLFHWLLAIGFTIAFVLGGEEDYLSIHAACGIMVGALVLFRVIQGFGGPRYARFSDFPISRKAMVDFIANMKQRKSAHPGHNPLASVIMGCIMITALLSAFSGMLLFASGEAGLFGFRFNQGGEAEITEEVHDVVVHLFLILVGIHLAGVMADTLFHPANGTVLSIFTGYKRINAADAKLSPFQKIFSIFWIVIPVLLFLYVVKYLPAPAKEKDQLEQVDNNDKDED
jgi:cytochrome b